MHAGLGLEPGPILRGDLRFEGGLAPVWRLQSWRRGLLRWWPSTI